MDPDVSSDVDAIFDAFGGATALARAIDAPITTCHSWKRHGRIPRWWHEKIDRAADEAGNGAPKLTREAA